jgi:hypothetical protein
MEIVLSGTGLPETLAMIIREETATGVPKGYAPIFSGEVSGGEFCALLAKTDRIGKIIGQTDIENLAGLELMAALGPNGSFRLYPIISGFKLKSNWFAANEKEGFALFCFFGQETKYIVTPKGLGVKKFFSLL